MNNFEKCTACGGRPQTERGFTVYITVCSNCWDGRVSSTMGTGLTPEESEIHWAEQQYISREEAP